MAGTLRETVLAGNWEAPMTAQRLGERATDEIIDLLTHEDRQVRLITVACLEEAGGEKARSGMIDALSDEDDQVRMTAARGLHNNPDPDVYARLMTVYDDSADAQVKHHIPMIIARNDGKITDATPLTARWEEEEDDDALEGMVVGLARLGNEDAKSQFTERLHSAAGTDLDRYLTHCEYIEQKWLINALAPVVFNKTKLRYIGPHGRDIDLRACDISLNLIAKLSGKRFSFEVNGRTNYLPEQLEEVKTYAATYEE